MRGLFAAVIGLVVAHGALAEVETYECDLLPLDDGWSLIQAWCDPQEWVANGELYQFVDICPGTDPPQGQQISYTRSLGSFENAPNFFVEWVVISDGPGSEVVYAGPALLSVYGYTAFYQFSIASDKVRFLADDLETELYVDIASGTPHRYRLEVFEDMYYWYIDDDLVWSREPTAPFPGLLPKMNIRAKAKFESSTQVWSWIRWGDVPLAGSGDYDTSETVDADDWFFFREYFSGKKINAGPGGRWADFDFDGDVDCADLQSFAEAWTAPARPPLYIESCPEIPGHDALPHPDPVTPSPKPPPLGRSSRPATCDTATPPPGD